MKLIKGNLTYVLLFNLIAIQFSNILGEESTTEVAEVAISCIQCGSGTLDACGTNPNEPVATDCDDTNITLCFTKFDANGNFSRGCLPTTDNSCTSANNCVTSAAGQNNQLICKTCATTDAACSQTDMRVSSATNIKICDAGQTQCSMKVTNKLVQRGCTTAKDTCPDATTCNVCSTVNCNVGIFPTKRINCYQCKGSPCNVPTADESKPCPNYVDSDQCYTKGESETTMVRGCKSDESSNDCTDTKDGCLFCNTDQCNNLSYKRNQKLKCYQCSDADCVKEQTSTDLKDCKEQVLYNDVDFCYTHVDGGKVERGCLHDNTALTVETCKDDNVCTKCTDKDGCNSKEVNLEFTCIVCRSDLEQKCWNQADTLTGSTCRVKPSSAEEGCFHGIWNGVAIRGCYVDANEQQQAICKNANNLQCNWCSGTNCNKDKSSGASTISMYFGLWFMVLIWCFK